MVLPVSVLGSGAPPSAKPYSAETAPVGSCGDRDQGHSGPAGFRGHGPDGAAADRGRRASPLRVPDAASGTSAEAMTNSVITATTKAPGTTVAAGCSRMIALAILAAVRIRSRPSAIASCGSGSGGPKPRLASCRSRRITALRWPVVSPGSRYTVTPRAQRSALPCSPATSRLPAEKSS